MKKNLLMLALCLVSATLFSQEVLTGWTFPSATGPDSLNANLGTTSNKTYDIRFQWVLTPTSDSTLNTITFTDGATTFSAATTGWDNGADIKFWSIKFKANNYTGFKLSSKQKSDAASGGPRDFKIQWRLSSTSYADVPNGTVTLGPDWTAGGIDNLPVPITNQGSSSIYIRWIMSSNIDVNGGTVAPAGQSMIDDILITGTSSTGQDEILFTNRFRVYPSPNNGKFTFASSEPVEKISVTDLSGKTLYFMEKPLLKQNITLPNAGPGFYILKVRFAGENQDLTTRFVVE